MKSLNEKLLFVGMYIAVFSITMICFWRLDSLDERPKHIENEIIVMNEK